MSKELIPVLVTFAVVGPLNHDGNKLRVGDSVAMTEADAESLLALAIPPIARTTPESAASTDDNGGTDSTISTGGESEGDSTGDGDTPPAGTDPNSTGSATGAQDGDAGKAKAPAGKDAAGRKETKAPAKAKKT